MPFKNLKAVLRAGVSARDRVLLAVTAAYGSRASMRPLLLRVLRGLSTDGVLWFKYKEPRTRSVLQASLRIDHLLSDLQTFLETGARDCYCVPGHLAPSVVIDGGANVGLFSLSASRRFPGAQLISCEPVEANLIALRRHLRSNGIAARVEPCCLGASEGNACFVLDAANRGRLTDETGAAGAIEVAVHPLARFVNEGFALIKLDVEGAEVAVLEAFLNQPRRNVYVVGELHAWPEHEDRFKEVLDRARWNVEFFERDHTCVLFHAYPAQQVSSRGRDGA